MAPTETNLREDALCFMVKTWARHKTTEALLNNSWRLVAVGGPYGLSLTQKKRVLKDSPAERAGQPRVEQGSAGQGMTPPPCSQRVPHFTIAHP